MPATTTTQSARSRSGSTTESRCRPATPTSSCTVTIAPSSSARILASWTTGPSEVPADTIRTRPRRSGSRRCTQTAARELVLPGVGDRGPRRRRASRSGALVTSTLDAPASSSATAIATACSTVLPSPRTTSGAPCRSSRWVSTRANPRSRNGRPASASAAAAGSIRCSATAARSSSISRREVIDRVYAGGSNGDVHPAAHPCEAPASHIEGGAVMSAWYEDRNVRIVLAIVVVVAGITLAVTTGDSYGGPMGHAPAFARRGGSPGSPRAHGLRRRTRNGVKASPMGDRRRRGRAA